MHGLKYLWITCFPLAWLVSVTFTAGWQKIFSPAPAIGFLAQAAKLEAALRAGTAADVATTRALIFNARLDAFVCGLFLALVAVILIDSLRVWTGILRGVREDRVREAPFVASLLRAEDL
jgi:carbon starvation protein